jgi:hypothetical protein
MTAIRKMLDGLLMADLGPDVPTPQYDPVRSFNVLRSGHSS